MADLITLICLVVIFIAVLEILHAGVVFTAKALRKMRIKFTQGDTRVRAGQG